MTHPCHGKKLSKRQIEVFEQIGSGAPLPRAASSIFKRLEAHGLIARAAPLVRRDSLGKYEIPQYFVPLPIHMQWCEWCSQQIGENLD